MEIWKPIPLNKLENYEVSNLGNVRNLTNKKQLKFCKSPSGYLFLRVTVKGMKINYKVHRLVMAAFVRIPKKEDIVNHINNIRYDNRLENLEYVTIVQNANRTIINKSRKKIIIETFESKIWDSAKEFYDFIINNIY